MTNVVSICSFWAIVVVTLVDVDVVVGMLVDTVVRVVVVALLVVTEVGMVVVGMVDVVVGAIEVVAFTLVESDVGAVLELVVVLTLLVVVFTVDVLETLVVVIEVVLTVVVAIEAVELLWLNACAYATLETNAGMKNAARTSAIRMALAACRVISPIAFVSRVQVIVQHGTGRLLYAAQIFAIRRIAEESRAEICGF